MTFSEEGQRTQIITADIIAQRPGNLRIEVISSLGMHLASFVMNDSKFILALPTQRKFHEGVPGPKSLKPLTPVELDPRWLVSFLFDTAPSGGGWKCVTEKGFLKTCSQHDGKLKFEVLNREMSRRTIKFFSAKSTIEMELKNFQPNVQVEKTTFEVIRPEGFDAIRPK